MFWYKCCGIKKIKSSFRLFCPSMANCAGESQEYCQLETFEPRCWKNEVIVIDKAVYGRHQIGKCISAKEAAFSQESDYFGCSVDVLDIVNSKCSGRKQCQIRIPDADLERTRTCLTGLQMFLEVSYKCLEGELFFTLFIVCFATFFKLH